MNKLFTDIGHGSLNKYGEELCGDQVHVTGVNRGSTVMVLADGLGSGVKACILSTLTAKILSTMIAGSMDLEDCVSTMVSTLPVCSERKLAYSTFSVIKVTDNREAEIIQYDNPRVILLRDGKSHPLPLTGMDIDGKCILRSKIALREHDTFIAMSDGVLHASEGEELNLDWDWNRVVAFVERHYKPEQAAKALTTLLLDRCCRLYGGRPGDDVTVCTLKIRPRKTVNVLIGPPRQAADDKKVLALFFAKSGRRIVCGGTTAGLVAAHLGREILPDPSSHDPEVPPASILEGVDLVTEGALTVTRVLLYARDYLGGNSRYYDWSYKQDGASRMARLLFEEATDVNFFVGQAINPAHQDPDLPIEFTVKMRLIEELAACLTRMGKHVKLSHF